MKPVQFGISILASCHAVSRLSAETPAAKTDSARWNVNAAAAYLDARLGWWMSWPGAVRDHETFCVSCHTVAPYALARPVLRAALAERVPTSAERKLLANGTKRVQTWKEVEPLHPDPPRGVPQ